MNTHNTFKRTGALLTAGFLTAGLLLGSLSSCGGDPDLLTYRYDYDLSKYIDLAEYNNLDAYAYTVEVDDERVQAEILATLSYYSRLTTITDRGAQFGDTVYIDYVGVCEGEEIENETDSELTIGTYEMPEEFEQAIIGHYAGDVISFDMTFATPFEAAPQYSGKDVHFDITLNEVCEQEFPAYTDDFVRGYLGYDSIAEYEASVRQRLSDFYNENLMMYIVSQTWSQVVENTEVKSYPKKELNQLYEQLVDTNKLYAQMYGLDFAIFLAINYDMTEDEFYDWAMEQAEATAKEEMISYAIARAENITLTEEEYLEGATDYAINQYEFVSLEAFEALYDRPVIRQTLMYDKVRELVADRANRLEMESGIVSIPSEE